MHMLPGILKNLVRKPATQPHPFVKRDVPAAYRGFLTMDAEKCIMCRACSLKCPTGCITVEPASGLWRRNIMACVYCNVCAEVCPVKCIHLNNSSTPPMAERQVQEYQCKPRVKKEKAASAEAASEVKQPESDAEAAQTPAEAPAEAESAPVNEAADASKDAAAGEASGKDMPEGAAAEEKPNN